MAGSASSRAADGGRDGSLGELVSAALSDISELVRCEIDLAKLELKADARRLGIGGALLAMAAFVGSLVLFLLCFALAYGLIRLGIWTWAAFLIVAGACVVIAGLAILIGAVKLRRLSGLRRTRRTVQDDLALLRREESPAQSLPGAGEAPSGAAGKSQPA
jgi:GNAT superfamily N-acetyltransferase